MKGLARTFSVAIFVVGLAACVTACGRSSTRPVVVASKNFTEQAVLGELLAQRIEQAAHLPVERRFYLAGTYICSRRSFPAAWICTWNTRERR